MAYDYPEPLKPGEYYVAYPHYYLMFVENEEKFISFLKGYLKINEPTSVFVGVTKDLKLVCKKNPENTYEMIQARREARKASNRKRGKK